MSRSKKKDDAELDVTSFMNLMVVLVPVLLLNMVFAQTTVLQIKLPENVQVAINQPKSEEKNIELIVGETCMLLNYPVNTPVGKFDQVEDGTLDFKGLSLLLQSVKDEFLAADKEKKDILLLLSANTDYQTIVSAMDTLRSYDAVVGLDVVSYELFPDIALGAAPENINSICDASAQGGGQ